MEKSARVGELGLLLALAMLWGASYAFIKVGVETIPPITFIAARTLIAGAVLAVAMRWRGVAFPRDAATWRDFGVQALLNSVVPFTLIAWAERWTSAGLATILNSTTPIFAFLLAALILRREPATPRKLAGVALGLLGVCLVVGVGALDGLGREGLAQAAVVLASAFYACAATFGARFKGLDPMAPAAGSLLCGAAMLTPLSIIVDRPWTLTPSAASLGALLGLSVFSTALAFVLYFRLVRTLGSVGVTAQAYLRAPIGVGIGALALGERLSATTWPGVACVLIGVVAMTWPQRQRPALA